MTARSVDYEPIAARFDRVFCQWWIYDWFEPVLAIDRQRYRPTAEIRDAEARGEDFVLTSDLRLYATTAWLA